MCLCDIGSSLEGSSLSPKITASFGALTHEQLGTMFTPGILQNE